ncbi:TrkA family potassium uptake protein [Streptococcaceae bacterium ESL0729]|nr:TrkA family potassium uptake protein [Streptococcaceae bacterium ESL0729]
MKSYAVIGLGRFGGSVVKGLIERGQEVLAIDQNENLVNDYMDIATQAVIGDAQDERMLKSLAIGDFDYVVVAIGENEQASTLTTLLTKELGVKTVIAKAATPIQAKVLAKVGADVIIQPEDDAGRNLAEKLVNRNIFEYFEISHDMMFAEMKVNNPKFEGKKISEIGFYEKHEINVAMIRHKDGSTEIGRGDAVIHLGDFIYVLGEKGTVSSLSNMI